MLQCDFQNIIHLTGNIKVNIFSNSVLVWKFPGICA